MSGFTLDAADALLADSRHDGATLDRVAALAERSLLLPQTSGPRARYRMLEPIRQFAMEQLVQDAAMTTETRERYLAYFAGLAERAEEAILGGPDLPWLQRLDDELPNLRAALTWGFSEQRDDAARLTVALIWYCYIRSLYGEAREWSQRARAMSTGRTLGRATHMAGTFAAQVGDIDDAERLLAEAAAILGSADAQHDRAMVLFDQCVLAYHRGDVETMRHRNDSVCALARQLQDDTRMMHVLWSSATLAEMDGEPVRACELWREAIAIAKRRDAAYSRALFLGELADTLIDIEQFDEARHCVIERLTMCTLVENTPTSDAAAIEAAGLLLIQARDPRSGLRLVAAARAVRDKAHFRRTDNESARITRWIDRAREEAGTAAAEAALKNGLQLPLTEAVEEAVQRLSPAAEGTASKPVLRTFMFTDIVGSTELVQALGDGPWRDAVAWHNRVVRAALATYGGEEVDNAGDGFFVAFADVAAAVECAVEIQRHLTAHRREHGFAVNLRIGMHASDALRIGGAYRGIGVHIASRICAQAGPGEILLSRQTALQAGRRATFSAPRTVSLKGVPGEFDVVSVVLP